MLHASTQQLIRKLCELTDASALAWSEGEGEASRLETEGYVVEVQSAPATLRLLRADGRELERADEAALTSVAWPEGEGTYADRVTEMANRAHRVARGAEHAIEKILSSLSSPPKAPPAFGDTESFVKSPEPPAPAPAAITPTPAPAPAPAPIPPATPTPPTPQPTPAPQATAAPQPAPRPAAPDMLVHGISARSVQGVESASTTDVHRAIAATTPQPTPAPVAPAPAPAPPPAPKPAPAGPEIYKPWS